MTNTAHKQVTGLNIKEGIEKAISEMHRMIDALAEGKTLEKFIETL